MKRGNALKYVLLWLLVAVLSTRVHPRKYTGGISKDLQAKDQVNHSALGMMLGEFRTSLSDMFYLQTENFLHYGVAFKPHDDDEHSKTEEMVADLKMGGAEENTHKHHDFDHGDEVLTVIPTAEKDYRSWLGNLHREIKPWQAPGEAHRLSRDAEVIPLFRLMTLADPHYVRGYQVGAFWIQQLDPKAAADFIAEGLKNNPDSFQLYLMRGLLNVKKARKLMPGGRLDGKDPDQRKLLLEAKADFQQAAEMMFQARPSLEDLDQPDQTDWTNDQETDAMAAVNMAVMLEQMVGRPDHAKQLAESCLKRMPENKHLKEYLEVKF